MLKYRDIIRRDRGLTSLKMKLHMLPLFLRSGCSENEVEDMLQATRYEDLYQFRCSLLETDDESPGQGKLALSILYHLALCQKGLSDYELSKLFPSLDVQRLVQLLEDKLGDIVAKYGILWVVTSNDLKRFISKSKLGREEKIAIHQNIAKSYELTLTKNLTLLEEKTYHIHKAKDYSGLKQLLADIEIFLLLYNPVMKLDLFRYWKFLESAGYEPVTEYAKSMDAFETRVIPPAVDLFKIILQLSRFFKEYADFENESTPQFLHPMILNKQTVSITEQSLEKFKKTKSRTFEDEGVMRSSKQLASGAKKKYFFNDFRDGSISDVDVAAKEFEDDEDSLISVNSFDGEELLDRSPAVDAEGKQYANYLKEIGILDEFERLDMLHNHHLQGEFMLDVSVPSHMTEFRRIHSELVYQQRRMRQHFLQNLQVENSSGEMEPHANAFSSQKTTGDPKSTIRSLDKPEQPVRERKESKETTYFHYKRWLWVMFPWVCIRSVRDYPFSYLIRRCYSSATRYMSVMEEKVSCLLMVRYLHTCP